MSNNNNNPYNVDESSFWFVNIIGGLITIVFGGIWEAICISVYFVDTSPGFIRIILIPFILIGLTLLINGVVSILQGLNLKQESDNKEEQSLEVEDMVLDNKLKLEKIQKTSGKMYIICFLLFWFGILAAATYISIKNELYSMVLGTIPFWIAGIYVASKN